MTVLDEILTTKESTIYTYVCLNPDTTVREISSSVGFSHDSTAHGLKTLVQKSLIEKGERSMNRPGRRPQIYRRMTK